MAFYTTDYFAGLVSLAHSKYNNQLDSGLPCSYGKCCNPSTSYILNYAADLVSYSPSVSLTRVVLLCNDTQDDDS